MKRARRVRSPFVWARHAAARRAAEGRESYEGVTNIGGTATDFPEGSRCAGGVLGRLAERRIFETRRCAHAPAMPLRAS
jgi:hypothetical protein